MIKGNYSGSNYSCYFVLNFLQLLFYCFVKNLSKNAMQTSFHVLCISSGSTGLIC